MRTTRTKARRPRFAELLLVLIVGCGGHPAPASSESIATLPCGEAQAAAAAFVAENKACTADADCEQTQALCFSAQDDCCVVSLARGHDRARWQAFLSRLDVCNREAGGGACSCCAGIPGEPRCEAGRCR